MFKKLFGGSAKAPVEPIFPTENYSIFQLTIDNSLAIATINTGYNNYANKKFFPWYAEVVIDIHDKNDNGHPTDDEAVILNELEEKIKGFLSKAHTVHAIGRVTRNGERDIIYYIDKPKFEEKSTAEFFDSINAIRNMNFRLEEDKTWNNVGSFIK